LRGQELVTLGDYADSVRERATVYSSVDEIPAAPR
jgi:hypothetical protein